MCSSRMKLLAIFFGVTVMCVVLLTPQSTYAAASNHLVVAHTMRSSTHSAMKPLGSGGGCSGTVTQGPTSSFAEYSSCLSENLFRSMYGDAYFTFGANNAALWSSCTITSVIVNSDGSNYSNPTSIDCLRDARNNATGVHYDGNGDQNISGVAGQGYFEKITWTGVYQGKYILGESIFSSEQFI